MTTGNQSAGDAERPELLVHILDTNEVVYDANRMVVQQLTRVTFPGDDGQPVTVTFPNTPNVRILSADVPEQPA